MTNVVVQGTAVASPYDHNTTTTENVSRSEFTKGEKQATRCRDPLFAVLLYVNVGAIAAVAAVYGPKAFTDEVTNNNDSDGNPNDFSGYAIGVGVMGVASLGLAGLMLSVLMCIPETLVKTSLIFVVCLAGLWAVAGFASGSIGLAIIGLIFFALMLCYARAVWSRIPFATANLVTATTAVRKNLGIGLAAYFMTILAFGWSLLWVIALFGIYDETQKCQTQAGQTQCGDPGYFLLFLLFISFFFTHQVIQNVVHCTTAGVVGTWWFAPDEAQCCCSSAVTGSLIRSLTTSFGSICFGSLVVAIIQALRQLASAARSNDDGNELLACVAECILACLESLVEYFNKWAYIYVGLYGYSYIEAGKNVFTLFRNRGWEAIIADDLVQNTLFFVSIIVGGIAGSIGLVLNASTDLFDEADGNSAVIAFLLGFIVGLVITSILMSVVGSGVNAVIVLFAEAPAEFQENHPELSNKMRETWTSTFPGCI